MLLKLEKLIAKYGMNITGVIQAGAHEGQEVELFKRLGIDGHYFEPCMEAFNKLLKRISLGNDVCYCIALGNFVGHSFIYTETKNNGQSNSILKPLLHLEYYENIVFEDREKIFVDKLDRYFTGMSNLLVLDVQGYELQVLKGATETLKHIDYIYTEVNREELYENCAMVEDLDNYLTEFRRVETKWKRKGFGDALYIRKTLL